GVFEVGAELPQLGVLLVQGRQLFMGGGLPVMGGVPVVGGVPAVAVLGGGLSVRVVVIARGRERPGHVPCLLLCLGGGKEGTHCPTALRATIAREIGR